MKPIKCQCCPHIKTRATLALNALIIELCAFIDCYGSIPIFIYLFKINDGNTRTKSENSSKLTIKTPERCGVVNVSFKQILHIILVFSLPNLNK